MKNKAVRESRRLFYWSVCLPPSFSLRLLQFVLKFVVDVVIDVGPLYWKGEATLHWRRWHHEGLVTFFHFLSTTSIFCCCCCCCCCCIVNSFQRGDEVGDLIVEGIGNNGSVLLTSLLSHFCRSFRWIRFIHQV